MNWEEVGAKAPVSLQERSEFAKENDPMNDPTYTALLTELQGYHAELLKGNDKLADNPVLAGEYQGKIRLGVSRLFAYMNVFIDLQVDISETYAKERQKLYTEGLLQGKSPSAADKHAGEMTRLLSNNEAVAKLRVQQVKNEYERYNGIAIYLATRMKEFSAERMMN